MAQLKPEKIAFISSIGGGVQIAGFFYPSSAPEIKGVVQICHGMAEYIVRGDDRPLQRGWIPRLRNGHARTRNHI